MGPSELHFVALVLELVLPPLEEVTQLILDRIRVRFILCLLYECFVEVIGEKG